MKTSILSISILFLMMTIMQGCTKGDTGPQGPAGHDGNANVMTYVYNVSWVKEPPSYTCDIYDTDITQDIVNYGVVLVYMSNGSGGWTALPCTLPGGSTYTTSYTPVHYLNGVTIWKSDSDMQQTADPGTSSFKVIAISATVYKAHPTLNWKDCNEVERALKLAD
ncbi:MAG: hypothetical protein WCL00_10830 [Bacteroidota bacterium]